MTSAGLNGLRQTIKDVEDVLSQLSNEDWLAPSAAEGWTVKDVVWHMGDLQNLLTAALKADPAEAPPAGIEQVNELRLDAHRTDTPAEVMRSFRSASAHADPIFEQLQVSSSGTTEAPFLDLGTYAVSLMADVCAFDFAAHLRYDILAPRGPIDARVQQLDAERCAPAVRWLIAGIPQMQPGLVRSLHGPIELDLRGPGGGRWQLEPQDDRIVVSSLAPDAEPLPHHVTSTSESFLAWATKRIPWRGNVELTDDFAADFLDALNLI